MSSLLRRYGQTALITGASSGIGEAFAIQLASRGFDLILVARREDRLHQLQRRLESTSDVQVSVIPADLSIAGASQEVCNAVRELEQEVSLLINNAGFGSHGELDQLDLAKEMNMVDLNCSAVLEMTHTLLPGMKQKRRGGIIITASVLSVFPGPYTATYAATKAFALAFAKALYGECKPYGVDVLAVLPGTTETEFFDVGDIKRNVQFKSAKPEEVVQTALKALGKKPMVVQGFSNKLGIFLSRILPVKTQIHIAKKALQ